MKVIHVLNHFLPQQTAGTEIYTWALSKQLQHKGVDVEVVIPNYGHRQSQRYQHDGLSVFQYAEPSVVDRSLIMGFRKPDGLLEFGAHLAEEKADIIHFHELVGSNGIGLQHIVTAKKTGAKLIMTFHLAGNSCRTGTLFYKDEELCDGLIYLERCSACYLHGKASPVVRSVVHPLSLLLYSLGADTNSWQNRIGTALGTVFGIDEFRQKFETLTRYCDRLIVLTQWYKRILVENGVPEAKIRHIPQGLPLNVAGRSIGERKPAIIPLRLMFLGRIDPLKGLHLLLEAIADMPDGKIRLDIYGQPGDEAYEAEWREKTATQRGIKWNGKLQQDDVVSTMRKHDALCLCSTFSEMSPLVIQEAFAAGIPVIASNVYGNAEQIVHETNGLLFQFKDSGALREQLLRCIDEPGLLDEMRRNIHVPRSFDEVGDAYYHVYKGLLAEV